MRGSRVNRSAVNDSEFATFFTSSYKRVVGSIALVTHDIHAAEDAAQEAFSRASVRWEKVQDLGRPDLWVIKVGINVAINSWNRHKKEGSLNAEIGSAHQSSSEAERIIHGKTLEWGLDQLTPKQRAAFVLHHAAGWDVDYVARDLGTSESTVRTHLRRAREKLRLLLGSEEMP